MEARRYRDGIQDDLFTGQDTTALEAVTWAVESLSERQAVFSHADLLAATLGLDPGAVSIKAVEKTVERMEARGDLHAATEANHGRHWATDAVIAREAETIALMRAGQGTGKIVMKRWVVETKLHRGRLNEGQKEAVKGILASKDRVVGVQGYAGTGKTTMLGRMRDLAESRNYRVVGLAPSASAARTLEAESGIASETLQRFLARHAGIVEGRGTPKGLRNLRAAFDKTLLVVDESSLASTKQMRDLLKVATVLRVPRVVLVGDEKQLDGVEAGAPFAQLKRAGMRTATMEEIVRQRDADLKEAVRASLAGEVKTAFEKLGGRVSEAPKSELGMKVATRWLKGSPSERQATGVIAPTRALRDEINETIRDRLIREDAVHGPTRRGEKLVSRGLTKAEMSRASTYAAGDTVIFNRRYKTLGVEKGDERTVAEVEDEAHTVHLEDGRGNIVEWQPWRLAGAKGGVDVYRSEAVELRAGDRVRFTRNDPGSGSVNGQMAEVESIAQDGVRFQLEDGIILKLADNDPQLRHLDRAWASTVHAFQGWTVDNIIVAMEANHPHLTTQKSFYVAISRARVRAELVTDDAARLAKRLETATGERIAALDAVRNAEPEVAAGAHTLPERSDERERDRRDGAARVRDVGHEAGRTRRPNRAAEHGIAPEPRPKAIEMDFDL